MKQFSGRKLAAALAQVGSYITTYAFFQYIIKDTLIALVTSALAELLMYYLKEELLENKDILGGIALVFDTLFNAGGIFTYIKGLDKTPTYAMLSEVFTADGKPGKLSTLTVFIVTIGLGLILSLAPHSLRREKGVKNAK